MLTCTDLPVGFIRYIVVILAVFVGASVGENSVLF
jgi:hypothetical protein